MADTGNPTISGTAMTFSGTASATFNANSNWIIWDVASANLAKYATTITIAAHTNAPAYQRYRGTNQPTSADYGAYANIDAQNFPTDSFGLWVRAVDNAVTGYRARINDDGTWSIQRWNGGASTLLLNGDFGSLNADEFHTMEFYALTNGNTVELRLYVDGALITTGGSPSGMTAEDTDGNRVVAQGYAVFELARSDHWRLQNTELRTEGTPAFSVDPIPATEQITNGNGMTLDLSNYVNNGTPPYTYTEAVGAPNTLSEAGTLALQSDGSISGVANVDGEYTFQFRVQDSDVGDETTNQIVVTVSSAVNDAPVWGGLDIRDFNITQNVAQAGLDISAYWTDPGDTFTVNEVGTWPTGVSLVAGVITINEATVVVGEYDIQAEADDGVNTPTPSNTFHVSVVAQGSNTFTVTSDIIDNGAESVVADTLINWLWFPVDMPTAISADNVFSGSATTNSSGILTTGAVLPAGPGHLFLYSSDFTQVSWKALTAV